uniref:Reverse transcriptase zinc-binding domain-containing protein n=1 Tax=Esox lucius TaxID=8010 RepID=A0A3P8XXY2_ESOLU
MYSGSQSHERQFVEGISMENNSWRGCGETRATHSHIFWQCPMLDNFWKSIFTYINKVMNVELIRDPLVAILGVKPVGVHSRKNMYLLQILLIAAKKAITIKWLKNESPNQADMANN